MVNSSVELFLSKLQHRARSQRSILDLDSLIHTGIKHTCGRKHVISTLYYRVMLGTNIFWNHCTALSGGSLFVIFYHFADRAIDS